MILIEEHAVDALIAKLESEYYIPRGLEPGLIACVHVKASGILELLPGSVGEGDGEEN